MDDVDVTWDEHNVVDVTGAELIFRTYVEHSDLRNYLKWIESRTNLTSSCDVGAGYGRMCPVLHEFSEVVVAFEREESLVRSGSYLLPTTQFRQIKELSALPAGDGEFDFALTFTVLQHLPDAQAVAATAEIRRIVRPGGYVLFCEETDETHSLGEIADPHVDFAGRPVERYKEWMAPFHLARYSPRLIERGYDRLNVGTYLLFRAPGHGAESRVTRQ
jgi:SAM-dependent methyltransferase